MKKYSYNELKKIEKKIDLVLKFSQFVLNDQKVLSRIPEDAHLALMPDDDFEIAGENFELTSKSAKKEKAHILAFVGHRLRKEQPRIQFDYKKKSEETCWV